MLKSKRDIQEKAAFFLRKKNTRAAFWSIPHGGGAKRPLISST